LFREIHGDFAVGLGGGVFQNKLLSEHVIRRLEEEGFRVYLPLKIPCNDGGLCYGQIIEAAL
jgi:hydrogenase maturation protein HypF